MKVRAFRKAIGVDGYRVSSYEGKLCIGSHLCTELISVDPETLELKYALDTFNKGKQAITEPVLVEYWDKIQALIDSGEIKDFFEGQDEIENPLPVFSVENAILIESTTDKYGWPNTDIEGNVMYENTHYPTKEEALEKGIKSEKNEIKYLHEYYAKEKAKLKKLKKQISTLEKRVAILESL